MPKKIKTPRSPHLDPSDLLEACDDIRMAQRVVDESVRNLMKTRPEEASCKIGCADCCTLLTLIGMGEGLTIAFRILDDGSWRERLPGLLRNARAAMKKGMCNDLYFKMREPCAFLDEDKTCGIYESRPTPCRCHFVYNGREACSIDAPPESRKISPNFVPLEEAMLVQEWQIIEDLGLDMAGAPIAIVVLAALKVWMRATNHSGLPVLKDATQGIPSPSEWFGAHRATLNSAEVVETVLSGRKKGESELYQIAIGGGGGHRVPGASAQLEQDLLPGDATDTSRS